MSKSIVGIAKSRSDVESLILDLQNDGIAISNISVLIPDSGEAPDTGTVKATKAPEGTTAGVLAGGLTGGTLGLLAGIGALAIPGFGAFIAAGPLMAALGGAAAGAATGGVIGALIGFGLPEYEAKIYEERLKEGGYLVAVHVGDSDDQKRIRETFERNRLENISAVTEK